MRFITYLKEKMGIILWLIFWLATVNIFLMTFRGSAWLSIYINVSVLTSFIIIEAISYYNMKKYFQELEELAENLDKKYLLPAMLKKGESQAKDAIYRVIKDMGKSMTEQVNHYKYSNREYKEYIEIWIHEIKIPIATAKLVLANHKTDFSSSIEEELHKIESYIEQALFYARSNYVEKDYLISKVSLQELTHQVLLRNKRELILRNANINLHDLDVEVLSDGKWLGFILNQIVSNSLKYAGTDMLEIEIFTVAAANVVELHIKDNGSGILKNELPLVFEKGFTGTKGRSGSKSTGIGLYLCKKLCTRLEHGIYIESDGLQGCEVVIAFAKTNYYDTLS